MEFLAKIDARSANSPRQADDSVLHYATLTRSKPYRVALAFNRLNLIAGVTCLAMICAAASWMPAQMSFATLAFFLTTWVFIRCFSINYMLGLSVMGISAAVAFVILCLWLIWPLLLLPPVLITLTSTRCYYWLASKGVRVGLLGVSDADLDKLRTLPDDSQDADIPEAAVFKSGYE